jgi:hypothetical protein
LSGAIVAVRMTETRVHAILSLRSRRLLAAALRRSREDRLREQALAKARATGGGISSDPGAKIVEAPGVEGRISTALERDGAATERDPVGDVNARGSWRTADVASLATALARAVLDGDLERARQLAEQVLGTRPPLRLVR